MMAILRSFMGSEFPGRRTGPRGAPLLKIKHYGNETMPRASPLQDGFVRRNTRNQGGWEGATCYETGRCFHIRGFDMGIKVAAAIALVAVSSLADAKDADTRVPYSPAQYLKNFALSVCIANGFESDEVVKEGNAAASGYLELGGLPMAAYDQAASLGKTFLAREYRSIHPGAKLTLMKCIDFFHSRELDRLAKKYSTK
jgi:hypothetical protein